MPGGGLNDMLNTILGLAQVQHQTEALKLQKQQIGLQTQQQQGQMYAQFQQMASNSADPTQLGGAADDFAKRYGLDRNTLSQIMANTPASDTTQRAYATAQGTRKLSGLGVLPEFGGAGSTDLDQLSTGAANASLTGQSTAQNAQGNLLASYVDPSGVMGQTPLGKLFQGLSLFHAMGTTAGSTAVDQSIAGKGPKEIGKAASYQLGTELSPLQAGNLGVARTQAATGQYNAQTGRMEAGTGQFNAQTQRLGLAQQGEESILGLLAPMFTKGMDVSQLQSDIVKNIHSLNTDPQTDASRAALQAIIQQQASRLWGPNAGMQGGLFGAQQQQPSTNDLQQGMQPNFGIIPGMFGQDHNDTPGFFQRFFNQASK